ncbi:hypothetical protein [Nonomuraea maritima]
MIFHPFGLFVFAILVGGVALFVVMSVELYKMFCGGAGLPGDHGND